MLQHVLATEEMEKSIKHRVYIIDSFRDHKKIVNKQSQVKDFSRPFIDTCLCGLISLRKATLFFSLLDVIVLGVSCKYVLCTYIPRRTSIIGLLFPFGPLATFLVCSVFGFVGAAIRDEKFVRIYMMAVLVCPAIFLAVAFAIKLTSNTISSSPYQPSVSGFGSTSWHEI